jgi:hypothetical protein
MKQTTKSFLYRIEVTDKKGQRVRHLAEVQGVLDESARRKIIHQTLTEGGQVHSITETSDRSRLPGERVKRHYGKV